MKTEQKGQKKLISDLFLTRQDFDLQTNKKSQISKMNMSSVELSQTIERLKTASQEETWDFLSQYATKQITTKTMMSLKKEKENHLFTDGTEDDDDDCPICLLSLTDGKALFRTTCGHVFHFTCVKKCVLMNQHGCPLCRRKFSNMTPPRTPLTQRNKSNVFPGFIAASQLPQEPLTPQMSTAPSTSLHSFMTPQPILPLTPLTARLETLSLHEEEETCESSGENGRRLDFNEDA